MFDRHDFIYLPSQDVAADVEHSTRGLGAEVVLADLCEVAVCERGEVRSAGRVASTPEASGVSAASLLATDRAALEVMGSS